MKQPRHDIAQAVQNMTAEECEVFDLLLLGYDPSDRRQLGSFLARVTSPLSEILIGMMDKGLIRKEESGSAAHLAINPAAAWFLTPPEERDHRFEEPKPETV